MGPEDADSADLFRVLVEHSADGIALVDGEGRLRFASPSSERMLGHPLAERLGQPLFDLVHPDDLPRVRAALATCLERPGAPVSAGFRVRHHDGSWHDIEAIAANRLADAPVAAIVVNFRDVTERTRSERALQASQERLRQFVERAEDIIYRCDRSGVFIYTNPTASRVTEYPPGELIGRHFLTLIRADYHDRAVTLYRAQIEDRTPNTYFEFPCVTRRGDVVWLGQHVQLVTDGDDVVGVQAIARDITSRKNAEERLRQSEARYRSLIAGAAYGIFRSTPDGTILDANPAFAQMLGYDSPGDLTSRNMVDFYEHPEDRARYVDQVAQRSAISVQARWRRKDGSSLIVHLTARRVAFEDEPEVCYEVIAEDVTARRALEQQLRRAQKMEAIGLLARGVAHDFNNVLAAILASADLLSVRLPPDHPARDEAEEIIKAAGRGATFTRKLLAFSGRPTQAPQVLDAHEIVTGMTLMLERLTSDGIELRLHTPGPTPFVLAESGELEQVVLNLVVNAAEAMPAGGTIDVTVESVHLDATALRRYPNLEPGRYARLSVRDTGPGIAPELQPHLFEPFFTTKNPATGSGLGLSIVYSIAKEAGGSVAVSSAPDQGTTFDVLLPLSEPPATRP